MKEVLQHQQICANWCCMDPALMAAKVLQRRLAVLLAVKPS